MIVLTRKIVLASVSVLAAFGAPAFADGWGGFGGLPASTLPGLRPPRSVVGLASSGDRVRIRCLP